MESESGITVKEQLVELLPDDLVAFVFVGISMSGDRIVLSNMDEASTVLQTELIKQEMLQDIMMKSVFPGKDETAH